MSSSLENIVPVGKDFYLFFRDSDGKLTIKKETRFKPYFFVSRKDYGPVAPRDKVKIIYTAHPGLVPRERKKWSVQGWTTYEADVLYDIRYSIDYHTRLSHIPVVTPRVQFLDIEVYSPSRSFPEIDDGKSFINIITVWDNYLEKYFIFFVDPNKVTGKRSGKNWNLYRVDSERALLVLLSKFWKKYTPDILTGWWIRGFDLKWILERARLLGIEKSLSPIGLVSFPRKEEEHGEYSIRGISVLDYLDLYRKFTYSEKESFSLDYISQLELGKGKTLSASDINEVYKNDSKQFIQYNINDVQLVVELDKKLHFLDLAFELKRESNCPYHYVLQQSKVVDSFILSFLQKKSLVGRSVGGAEVVERFKGAFVMEPVTGRHEWIIDLDFVSLYPSIIRSLNISPETLVSNPSPNESYYKAANNTFYCKCPRGIIPQLLDYIFERRLQYSKEMKKWVGKDKEKETFYYNKQYTYKILLNSFYGYLGYGRSRFYNINLAEAVTVTGQLLIQNVINELTGRGYKVVYGDTDSSFIALGKRNFDVGKLLDEVNSFVDFYAKFTFGVGSEHYLKMDSELVADVGLFFPVKKRYFLHLVSYKGGKVDRYEKKGLEIVRSDTPVPVREFLERIYKMVLHGKSKADIEMEINNFWNQIVQSSEEEVGNILYFPTGLSKKLKDYMREEKNKSGGKKGKPIAVRASENWNSICRLLNRRKIQGKEKIRYVYIHPIKLRPNHPPEDVLGWELTGGENYPFGSLVLPGGKIEVDRRKMFHILVESKLESLYQAMNWGTMNRETFDLETLF